MQLRYNCWKISVEHVDSLIRPIVVNTHCECELAVCKVIRENIDASLRRRASTNIFATLFFQRAYLSSRLEMLIDVCRAF